MLLLADFALDLTCLYQFAVSGKHWGFAAAQGIIVGVTLIAELRSTGPVKLLGSFLESRALGFPTDTYLRAVKSEKSIEAPLSLLLQYFAALYMSESLEAFFSSCASMIFSVLAITKAAYMQLHLGLNELLDLEDESDADPDNPLRETPAQPQNFPEFPPGLEQRREAVAAAPTNHPFPALPPGLPPPESKFPALPPGLPPPNSKPPGMDQETKAALPPIQAVLGLKHD